MKLTVIGMGNMGRALAQRLLRGGHEVTVWNRTPGRAGDVVDAGGREVGTPQEAVSHADAVLLSLADDDAVLSVVIGEGRLADLVGPAAVLVDTSTVSPSTSRTEAGAVGIHRFVAAPVMGAPAAVQSGLALYLLGGPDDALDRLSPLWESLSEQRRRCGQDPGAATAVKLMGNYLLMAGVALLSEVVAMSQAFGMEDDRIIQLLGEVPVVAPALRNRLEDIVRGDHDGWFSARLGAKDVRLAQELAAELGLTLPMSDAVRSPYLQLIDEGHGDLDIAGVVETVRGSSRVPGQ